MAGKPIGSVFLGDATRIRSLSTPPSSPLPEDVFSSLDDVIAVNFPDAHSTPRPPAAGAASPPPPLVAPELALEMRLRWLEALLFGVRGDQGKGKGKAPALPQGHTLIRAAEDVQRRLDGAVEGNDGLRRFMDQCASPLLNCVYARVVDRLTAALAQMISMRRCSRRPLRSLAFSLQKPHQHTRTCPRKSLKRS